MRLEWWSVSLIVIPLVVMARLLTFGVGDPWLDEITNWQLAEEHGLGWRPVGVHQLSYLTMALGLRISDSLWGLRLFSALVGAATLLVVFFHLRWRQSPLHGWLAFALVALSPMAIFYSQDANHYAPVILAGFLAVMAIDLFMSRPRGWLVGYPLLILVLLLPAQFHPLGLFPLVAGLSAPFLWLVIHAGCIGPSSIPPRTRVLFAVLVLLAMAGCLVGYLFIRFGAQLSVPPDEGRMFGLNWYFLSGVLGSFYGAFFVYTALDTLLGVTGALATMAGLVLMIRRETSRWLGVGCLFVVLVTVLPFTIFSTRQFFAPRYLSAALIPLLIPMVHLMVMGVTGKSRVKMVGLVFLLAWGGTFTARSLHWNVNRLGGHFQPSKESLRWIAEHTGENARIVTHHRYHSLGTRFLWNRLPMGGRDLIPTSQYGQSPAVALQQIYELIHQDQRPLYLYTLEDLDRHLRGYGPWLDLHTEVVREFSGWSPDAFVPINWHLSLRRVTLTPKNPFALPRPGSMASVVYPEHRIGAIGGELHGTIPLEGPSGAGYFIDASEDYLEVEVGYPVRDEAPLYVVLLLNGSQLYFHKPSHEVDSEKILVPITPTAGRMRLDVILPASADRDSFRQKMHIRSIAQLQFPLDDTTMSRGKVAKVIGRFGGEVKLYKEDLHGKKSNEEVERRLITLAPEPSIDLLFVVQRQRAFGLGDLIVRTRLHSEDGARFTMGHGFNWNYSDAYIVGVIRREKWRGEMELLASFANFSDFRPRDYRLIMGEVLVHGWEDVTE